MNKFSASFNIALALFILSRINPIISETTTEINNTTSSGGTTCYGCGYDFIRCTPTTDETLGNSHDKSLIVHRPNHPHTIHCLPNYYWLKEGLQDHLCFTKPRCMLVVNVERWGRSESDELCKSCARHCGCKPMTLEDLFPKKKNASMQLNGQMFYWVIFISSATLIRLALH